MNLARMMTDKFFIEDGAGNRRGPFKTRFGGGALTVFQSELEVAPGDRVVRPMPDGSELVYAVESSGFSAGSRNVPPHFSLRISEQADVPDAAGAALRQAGKDFHGIAASLQLLAQAIDSADTSPQQKEEARKILRALLEHPVVAVVLAGADRP